MPDFDVLVIGAGHAGVEAAWAAARMGCHVGICTLSKDSVAAMPCNPAIGGTAKGHLVREIDALGGLMGRAIDATGIQFKLLNRSRGPAVWSPRAQADKKRYGAWVRAALEAEGGIEWVVGEVYGVWPNDKYWSIDIINSLLPEYVSQEDRRVPSLPATGLGRTSSETGPYPKSPDP